MGTGRIIGIALLVVGVILLYFGYNATQSGAEQIGEAITGNYSDETIFYLAAVSYTHLTLPTIYSV